MLSRASGECLEQLVEPHGLVLARDARPSHVRPRQARDRAGAVGDAIERRVVEGEDHPVAREAGVGLEVAIPEGHRVRERGPRVLGAQTGAATVRERQRPRVVEERELGRHGRAPYRPSGSR
jgi:hypothetical protein